MNSCTLNNPPFIFYVISICHYLLVMFMMFGWLSNNIMVLKLIFFLLLITMFLFIQCNGCIISKLEKKLSQQDKTVVDPLLRMCGIEISRTSRTKITFIIYIISLSITTYKLCRNHE